MMVLLPTRRGTSADHAIVPDAVPALPVEVVHCTEATPTLSLAFPLTVIVADVVDIIDEPGVTIVRMGAMESAVPVLGGDAGGAGLGPTGALPPLVAGGRLSEGGP